jgi:hypothetical protein
MRWRTHMEAVQPAAAHARMRPSSLVAEPARDGARTRKAELARGGAARGDAHAKLLMAAQRGESGSRAATDVWLGLGWLSGVRLKKVKGVDVKSAPHAKHTASRTSWLNTRCRIRSVPVNFP